MAPVILNRVVSKLFNRRGTLPPTPSPSQLTLNALHDPKIILVSLTVISLSIYLFASSKNHTMSSAKRPDKTTTGFFNPSIDCFANSTIQCLSAIPSLNVYLNAIANVDLPPNVALPNLPLHDILRHVISRLQTPIYYSNSISVWDILHVLEKIHKAKMNRIQHDAQELMQLIIETLEVEYKQIADIGDAEDVPNFPFKSIIESKLRCMRCQMTSSPSQSPMNIISLNVPQKTSTSLDSMLKSNQSEIIEGYSCFICTLTYIYHTIDKPSNQSPHKLKLDDQERSFLYDEVFPSLLSKTISINDDLADSPLYKSIKLNNPFLSNIGKSTVHREIAFIEVPTILPIHLSRSIFADTQALRNPCSVEFPEQLQLSSSSSNITYKLKSVIRHQGSHHSGHYECYKSKPMFYKRRTDGGYYNDYPSMVKATPVELPTALETPSSEATPSIIDTSVLESSALNTSLSSNDETVDESDIIDQLGISLSEPVQSPTKTHADFLERSRSISNAVDDIPQRGSIKSRTSSTSSRGIVSLRRRVSSIIGGGSSGKQQQQPLSPPPQPVIAREELQLQLDNTALKRLGDKKLASVVKKPFWRISDGKVSEVSLDSVLGDGKAAYMLIYEMVS